MDSDDVLHFLNKAMATVKAASPLIASLGLPLVEKISGIADVALEVAENVLKRAEESKIVLHTTDEVEIREIIEGLRKENDHLAAIIASS